MGRESTGRVVFLSNHHWRSNRRAGFHGLAQAFRDGGWQVCFVTTGVSRVSFLKTDPRLGRLTAAERNAWVTAPDGVETFVYCPPVHPFARFRGTDAITDRLFAWAYARRLPEDLLDGIAPADLVVFESSAALLLFDPVRRRAPGAALVYRVSDDVRVVGMAPAICAAEAAVIDRFDLVSVPSRRLLGDRFGKVSAARFQPHGVDLSRLAAAHDGPLPELGRPSCVALGTTLFDTALLAVCADGRPDMRFHILGALPAKRRIARPNIEWHGERPFAEALRHAAACDVAAAFYRDEPGTEYLAETSNKIAQYAYLHKPVIGPRHLAGALPPASFVAIDPPTAEGAWRAIGRALAIDPPAAPEELVQPWSATRDAILTSLPDWPDNPS